MTDAGRAVITVRHLQKTFDSTRVYLHVFVSLTSSVSYKTIQVKTAASRTAVCPGANAGGAKDKSLHGPNGIKAIIAPPLHPILPLTRPLSSYQAN